MKFYVAVISCILFPAVLCITDEMKQMAAALHKTCVDETGVDEALIAKVNADKAFPDDDKLKCYTKCIMTQTGVMDDKGIIDNAALIAILPDEYKEKATPVVNSCGTKVGANPCENAWLTQQCYLEHGPDDFVLI